MGATISLAVTLHNDWAVAGSVSATLVSGDSHATVTKPNANWEALGSGQTSDNSADPFQVTMQAGAFGLEIPFTLNALADGVPTTLHFTATTESVVQQVSGPVSSNTIWTSDRVWQVIGTVSVNSGITLTIQPGTVVKFNAGKALIINGTLIADGTSASPIRFTSNATTPAPGDWGSSAICAAGGIVFTSNSQPALFDVNGDYLAGSIIRNAIVEYGQGIGIAGAAPFVDHNLIQKNAGGSSYAIVDNGCGSGAKPVISHNRIVSNMSIAVGILTGEATVRQNQIVDNQGGAMLFSGGWGSVISNTISGNGHIICGSASTSICLSTSGNQPVLNNNNIYGNRAAYDVAMQSNAGQVVTATHNYWGSTDTTAIRSRIYDNNQDAAVGTVNIDPILTQPEPTAPAFLSQLSVAPASPVGIQQVTFDLIFSAPMDQSGSPIVTFGSAGVFDTYPITDNALWVDATHWQATFHITSLVPRGAFTVSVSGASGADGMQIPQDNRFGFTVDYAGQITDQTPPSTPSVFATGISGVPSSAKGSWLAVDNNSPIIHYRYAIGTAAEAVDVVNWTLIDATTVTRTGLGLVSGQNYWFSVQAQNQGGLWSPVGSNEFVAGVKKIVTLFLPVLRR